MYLSLNCCLTVFLHLYTSFNIEHLPSSAVVFLNHIANETECPVQVHAAGHNFLSFEMVWHCILQTSSGRPLKEGSLTNNFLILITGSILIYM